MLNLYDMRRDYRKAELDESHVDASPFVQFEKWFGEALQSEVLEPNAMQLATADTDGFPDIRAVLLKIFDTKGFVFFTNYNSVKARQISANPQVAAAFLWLELERQVRIRGRCEKISVAESAAYFMKRSRGSQLGAWVSDQSTVLTSRKALSMMLEKMKEKFKEGEIPLPDFWGGYRIIPQSVEF
ncbi:MAG: pyridoxamine 5'-phosphate oxidase, partial [Campylobacterales bacterium]|nr:pyridoxamine 5'-phosphate oxidase [Campylobacterales bacterium]